MATRYSTKKELSMPTPIDLITHIYLQLSASLEKNPDYGVHL